MHTPRANVALLILCLAAAGSAVVARSVHQRTANPLVEGDRLYREKSFAGALKSYEAAAKAGRVPRARRQEIRYRIAVCLGRTEQWDRALAESLVFVKENRGSVWEPRGLYWLGRLYTSVPHQGYRVGKALHRGSNVPRAESRSAPQQTDVSQQDALNARDALEAARVLYPRFRGLGNANRNGEIQLDFDLSTILQSDPRFAKWAAKPALWTPPADGAWAVDPSLPYDPAWPMPKKQLYLFAEIRMLSRGTRSDALALLAESMWLQTWHRLMAGYAVRYENDKPIRIPYPYENRKPEQPLRALIASFPQLPARDQAQILLGSLLQQGQRFNEALKEYRSLLADRPKSMWTQDARAAIDQITRKGLSLQSVQTHVPGETVQLTISSRNIDRIHFRLHRVRLEAIVASERRLGNPDAQWNQFEPNFGPLKRADRSLGPAVKEWDETTSDRGEHRVTTKQVRLPISNPGAYVVVASTPGVRAATVVLISDLALVQKSHRDGLLLFAANARTGAPAAGANVIVKRTWYEQGKKGVQIHKAAWTRLRTGPTGLASVPIPRTSGIDNQLVSSMAWQGASYALTDANGWYFAVNPAASYLKLYCTTDRSVYRPRQTVNYRELVYRRANGDLVPFSGHRVHVEVRNPKGELVHRRDTVTSEFGSVNGRFELPEDAPLGEYGVTVSLPNGDQMAMDGGASRFRVEEYKKPEFEVTVTPAAERVRPGQPTSVKIAAKYYFGGPVPAAKVTYRIHRSYYAQQYRFPRPFDFLWRHWGQGDYDTSYRNGPVIKQGETHLDAKGEATVEFPTEAPTRDQQDQAYTVDADVQDASRRVISGSGAVKATRHDVAVFLDYPHGYAAKGERLDVEIVTLNPSDQPVSAAGSARVYRVPQDPNGKEALIHEEPITTDSHGRAYLHWTATTAGFLRIAFETRDTAGEKVEGSTEVCVSGPELDRGRFRREGVFLAIRNPYYEEGQTARALLVTPETGCTVLLTREANDEILEKRIIFVPGRSIEVPVPLGRADVPNVYLSAILIRHGQMFSAQQEIFVPPARRFTTISVQADRERYQPGEKATLHLSAKDWRGRPLRTELAVSVSDAALSYIQKDYAPDIRAALYGDRRGISTEASGSTSTTMGGTTEDTQPVHDYRTHSWELPGDMGLLPEWPASPLYQVAHSRRALGDEVVNYAAKMPVLQDRAMSTAAALPQSGGMGGMPGFRAGSTFTYDYDESKTRSEIVGLGVVAGESNSKRAEATTRTRFADTAFWTPAVITDSQGNATVQVTWPDNLTRWRAQAVGSSAAAQVGAGETSVATRKDLIVRLQAPRFFVERDQVTLSANVHNYTGTAQRVRVLLDLSGDNLQIQSTGRTGQQGQTSLSANASFGRIQAGASAGRHAQAGTSVPAAPRETWVNVPSDGESRVDWTVQVRKEGPVRVRMTAQSDTDADAAEMTFPAIIHGVERMTAVNGVMGRTQQGRTEVEIELPAERKPGSSELVVTLNPSLATVMLDALPYLADYPYGCVEQTMSRFLPSLVVAKTLNDLGYNLGDLRKRAQTLKQQAIENRKSKIENSPYSYPKGALGSTQIGAAGSDFPRINNPLFDEATLNRMVTAGFRRLYQMQHRDGGWGWWPDDSSDPYMTAYVLYGLQLARGAGQPIQQSRLTRGLDFLRTSFLNTTDPQMLAYEGRVLSMDARYRAAIRPRLIGLAFPRRERLSAYSKALLAIALHNTGDREKAGILLRNIETTAKVDEAGGTVHWEDSDRFWWCWWNDKVETNAAVLEAYLQVNPASRLVPMAAKWLANNRRGDAWASTRETSLAILALADYARVTKELAPNYTLTVDLGGRIQRRYIVNHENVLFFDNRFVVPDGMLRTGRQPLTITKTGTGTLYYSAYTRYFSLEEPIRAASNEIAVNRRYFRLLPGTANGTPEPTPIDEDRPNPFLTGRYELLDQGGEWIAPVETAGGPQYDRVELKDGDPVESGDQIEVDLELDARNDYTYLVVEDLKPSGCEPVELRSGGKEGLGLYSNMELRDQKVAFFLSSLPQGARNLTYRLRAEIPGDFHVLPANGYAIYAPEVRALSSERHLTVRDGRE